MNLREFFRFLGLTGVLGKAPAATALTTVGAGTVTAAGIVGGVTTRGGAQSGSSFTDTTDTAANIIAAMPGQGAVIGVAWYWTYQNATNGQATITGGTGVTVSGVSVVPPGSWATFLVTYSAAGTVTAVGVDSGPLSALPAAKYTTRALSSSTAAAGELSGANYVVMNNSGANPGTYTTRTAAQMFADTPNAYVGQAWIVRLKNGQGTGVLTLAGADANTTVTGTATLATNTWRDFHVTFNSATTMTFQQIGTGTDS